MRRVKNVGYSPTQEEIRELAQEIGLKSYCPDLVADIAAICEGNWELEHDLTPKSIPEFVPDIDGDYRLSTGRYTKSLSEKENDWVNSQVAYHKNIQNFLTENASLWERTPGETPLHKALLALKKLSESSHDSSSTDGEGVTIPIPTEKSGQQETKESYSEDLKILEKLTPEDYDYLGIDEGDQCEAFTQMTKAEQILFKVDQYLEGKAQLKVKPKSKLIFDPEGNISLFRQSRSISDLTKANKKVLMSRNIGYSLLSGKGKVPVQYKRDTPQPLISIMVDNSGSMTDDDKDHKAWGIIYHLAKKAAKGECALILASFVSSISDVWYIPPTTEVKDTMKCLKLRFNGGTTEVGKCAVEFLEKIKETITNEGLNVDPNQSHIVIVNDGQDDATSLTLDQLGSTTLHGLILESSNDHIKALCHKTGGLYLESL
jgi:hypothetical protein